MPCERQPELQNRVQTNRAGTLSTRLNPSCAQPHPRQHARRRLTTRGGILCSPPEPLLENHGRAAWRQPRPSISRAPIKTDRRRHCPMGRVAELRTDGEPGQQHYSQQHHTEQLCCVPGEPPCRAAYILQRNGCGNHLPPLGATHVASPAVQPASTPLYQPRQCPFHTFAPP